MALTLPHETWGNGPTRALLLHGFTGSRRSFDHLAPKLSDVLAATVVDLPGHAGAPLPEATGEAAFEAVLDALEALLETPMAIIGYSQGARVALALAARAPHKVTRLVLESVTPPRRRNRDRQRRRLEDETRARQLLAKGVTSFVDAWERLPLFQSLATLSEADRATLRARRLSHSAEGLAGALRCMGQGVQRDLWPVLPSLRVPTLVLSGSADVKATRHARTLCAELPMAWRATFAGVGHAPHLECPDDYVREVRAFFAAGANDTTHPQEEAWT